VHGAWFILHGPDSYRDSAGYRRFCFISCYSIQTLSVLIIYFFTYNISPLSLGTNPKGAEKGQKKKISIDEK